MQWVAGKLTKPALKSAHTYLAEHHPDSVLTSQLARVATSDAPLAPSEDGPLTQPAGANASAAGVPASSSNTDRSLRGRAQGMMEGRAKTYAVSKVQNLIWQQICLPLTGVLWALALLLGWVEDRAAKRAQVPKDLNTHERDVGKIVSTVRARPEDRYLGVKVTPSHVSHMLRSNERKQGVGPATALRSKSPTSPGANNVPHALHPVDMSKLTKLLSLDTTESTVTVEASMTFRDLLRATLVHRLMPAVVPPFPEQTVGGAFVGGAISSASFVAGSFAGCVRSVRVVLGNGDVLQVDRDGKDKELFHALPGSFHTIGTVVALTIQLVKAPRYVHLKYENFKDAEAAMKRMAGILDHRDAQKLCALEGLLFTPTNITLIAAEGIDEIDASKHKVLSFAHWWDTPFTSYVRDFSTLYQSRSIRQLPVKHCVSLTDYLFRYDQQSFWLGDFVYHLLPWPLTGAHFISRLLFGWALNDANMRSVLAKDPDLQIQFGRLRIVQDAHLPLAHVSRWLNWMLSSVTVTPLWLCPVLASKTELLSPSFQHAGSAANTSRGFMYVNVGCYGRPTPHAPFDAEELNTELLEQTYKAGGRTLLHAQNWHTPELLAQMYDRTSYDVVRAKYSSLNAYAHLFDKIPLSAAERDDLRKPYDQPERPALHKMANAILFNKINFF